MLINILGKRSHVEMAQIVKGYKLQMGKDLIDAIKGETGGHFEDLLVSLCMTPWELDAQCVREAIKGLGTNESLLLEVTLEKI